jgi:hypothetical protein
MASQGPNNQLEHALISGLLDGSITLNTDAHGEAFLQVRVSPLESDSHTGEVIEIVIDAANIDKICRILQSGSPIHPVPTIPCRVGIRRRR